ncbi:MAG: hypothetical protein Q7J68_00780 [Thermoplasmata archaeon]|nr:hypothetical protein [Thermoplasmata archaeon]
MVERLLRRPKRVNIRRPLPPPPSEETPPVRHTAKKPKLAVTGMKVDRICAICLGKLEPGMALSFCNCGKFFHLECIAELDTCPLCEFAITLNIGTLDNSVGDTLPDYEESPENDIIEIVYQCPECESYVHENSEKCSCGAIFDAEEEEIYLCPGCEKEMDANAVKCPHCGMIIDWTE